MKPTDGSTVIGQSVVIQGGISGSEDLYIDGNVEGSIHLIENRLTIGANANVRADIDVRDVVVLGRLNGNVRATGRVELRQTAVVTGDIISERLSIEENAQFTGKVELKSGGQATQTTPKAIPVVNAPAEPNPVLQPNA